MSNTRTPKSLRDRAARLQKEGGNQDLINKLLDDANAMEREGYEAGKKSGAYKAGGSTGMHRMPDGKMMRDSAHKGMMGGGKVKGYAPGGSTGKSPEMKTMPNTRPVPKDAKFGDQDAPNRKSPYMKKLKGGGSIGRGYGKARGAKACRMS